MVTKRLRFASEPWGLTEEALDLDHLAQTESLFALSNGHIGLRANLEEGEPQDIPGTYLNAFYELRPLPYAEAGYGYPESGQTVVNVTDGKVIRLLVDDENFDCRYGRLVRHHRHLDFRAGTLTREAVWESPAGRRVRVCSTRLVSFAQRAVAAIEYRIEPLDDGRPTRFVVQSELVANQPVHEGMPSDPRAAAVLANPLAAEDRWQGPGKVILIHRTNRSELRMAAGMDHQVDADGGCAYDTVSSGDLGRYTITTELKKGQSLRLLKFIAYGWSSRRSAPSLRDQVDAALASARHSGWEGLVRAQREYLDDFWERADVEVDGDDRLQQAVRFGLFHVLQSGARAEERAIAAKGLTGPGYDGHTFWDSESFVLQVLTYTAPEAAASALRWRHATLDLARTRAGQLHLKGAAFPWRTIRGQECSGYWPAGTAAFHINADIADAVLRYRRACDDEAFFREYGVELLIETARLWFSLGHFHEGQFRIDGVTGPDEYSAIADNNAYTNLMAQQNLAAAADAAQHHPAQAGRLQVEPEEIDRWREAAAAMRLPFSGSHQVHEQAEGFTRHQPWDFEHTKADQYPLLLHFPYFDIYRKQVLKQADLVLALHLRGDAFSAEEKRRAFDYYERFTVRDSSLSACTQAVIAAEVGHLQLALDYFAEAALMDLDDREHNVRDGLHMAALAGGWIAAVAGFGGMRDHGRGLEFRPRAVPGLRALTFNVVYRGRRLRVRVGADTVTYRLVAGESLVIRHEGREVKLARGRSVRRSLPEISPLEPPRQPEGRAPAPHRVESSAGGGAAAGGGGAAARRGAPGRGPAGRAPGSGVPGRRPAPSRAGPARRTRG